MDEKKTVTKKLERTSESSYQTFEAADAKRMLAVLSKPKPAKAKIFARRGGTFDLVLYGAVQTKEGKK